MRGLRTTQPIITLKPYKNSINAKIGGLCFHSLEAHIQALEAVGEGAY